MRRYLVLAITAVIVSAAAGVIVRAQSNAAQARVIQSAADGRYQIVVNPSVRADTFLLDTQTGKIWIRTSFSFLEGSPDAWLYQERLDNSAQEDAWIATHAKNKPQ
jgi:hypothetical protein